MPFLLLYWRQIAAAVALLALLAAGLYVRHVFAERAALRVENQQLQQQVAQAVAAQRMMIAINDAREATRRRSIRNVQTIDTEPAPAFAGGAPLLLVPGGLLQALYSSSGVAR